MFKHRVHVLKSVHEYTNKIMKLFVVHIMMTALVALISIQYTRRLVGDFRTTISTLSQRKIAVIKELIEIQ